jgi:hypothetical protein
LLAALPRAGVRIKMAERSIYVANSLGNTNYSKFTG